MKSICCNNITYKQVSKDLIVEWFKNRIFLIGIILPWNISFMLLFVHKNNIFSVMNSSFSVLSLFILINCGILLPIFIFKIKNNIWWKNKYGNYINSWKLTYFISIYSFIYTIVLAFILFLLWLLLFSVLTNTNYYGVNLFNTFSTWIKNISFINWLEIIFYYGYQAILAIAISFAINSLIKKYWLICLLTILIVLYNFFFIGSLNYNTFLYGKYSNIFLGFSYLGVYSFTSINGWIATMGMGAFNFVNDTIITTEITSSLVKINHLNVLLNFTIPFIIISVSITLSSIRFRWFDNINQNTLSSITKIYHTNKKIYLINLMWIVVSLVMLIVGISLTIISNISYKRSNTGFYLIKNDNISMVNDPYYISGVFFIMAGIINLSLSAGYLVKNIYVDIQNKLQEHTMKIYSYI